MKDCINRNMCDIVRLCKEYVESDYAMPYMRERTNIPLGLLEKGVILSLPDPIADVWNDIIEEIEEILDVEHIDYVMENKKLVKIIGYDMAAYVEAEGQYPKINVYSWCIFEYTYVMANQDRETRIKFLWWTILFPYLYKLNIYSPTTFAEETAKLLKEYSFVERENSEDETLRMLSKCDPDNEFQRIVEDVKGLSALLPSKSDWDRVSRISRSGWENLTKGY